MLRALKNVFGVEFLKLPEGKNFHILAMSLWNTLDHTLQVTVHEIFLLDPNRQVWCTQKFSDQFLIGLDSWLNIPIFQNTQIWNFGTNFWWVVRLFERLASNWHLFVKCLEWNVLNHLPISKNPWSEQF